MNLIEEVLKVEANYRSALDAHMASGSVRTEAAANNALGRLKDIGRTAAPKLARALQIALKPLKNFAAWEGDPMMQSGLVAPDRDDEARAVREILAEIEKEIGA